MAEQDQEAERQSFLDALLRSDAPRKLIVAGPGTGKTYSFRRILEAKSQPRLVLTFINNLVEDLERELGDIADVETFHRFCRGMLHRHGPAGVAHDVDYYPPLTQILTADAAALLGKRVTIWDVEGVLHTLDIMNEILIVALRCGDYYNAVGHTDSVYRMVRHFEEYPGDIPRCSQIVVDEFQDFSALEVRFIELLAALSPTLVVGDDDQALYEFKHASPEHLRQLVAGGAYERFDLPYCSRCTDVLVRSVHRVVEVARRQGLLEGRLEKPFDCYLPKKGADSERYPKIIHARCSVQTNKAPFISRYVEEQIRRISPEDIEEAGSDYHPPVLVTGPVQFASRVYEYLAERFERVEYKRSEQPALRLVDGYRRLLDDSTSRLGWRIVAHVERPDGFGKILQRAVDRGEELADLLPDAYRVSHLELVDSLRRVGDGQALEEEEVLELEAALGLPLPGIERWFDPEARLRQAEDEEQGGQPEGEPRIVVTSLVGAKGLQACHVFVVGVNDDHFPRDNGAPTDTEVCELIVALTRATKCCHLVSCGRFGAQLLRPSVFVDWLADYLDPVDVNAAYFER